MRASEVISSLQQRGVTLKMIAGSLKIGGAEKLTDREKSVLKAHRAAILRALPPHHQATTDTKTPVAPPYTVTEPSGPCPTCGSNHFWLASDGWQCWGCTEPEPRATTLCIPASQPTPDTSGNIPYRLAVGNVPRLEWLQPNLDPAEVLRQTKARYPDLAVTDSPPAHGWPRLQAIPEVPKAGTPQPVECWTPSGKRLVVTAHSPEHAEAIRCMNPPRHDVAPTQRFPKRENELDPGAGRDDEPPVATLADKQTEVAKLVASGMTAWEAWQIVDPEGCS